MRFELPKILVVFNVFGKKTSTKKNCSLKCTNWMLSLQYFCFSLVCSSNVFLTDVVVSLVPLSCCDQAVEEDGVRPAKWSGSYMDNTSCGEEYFSKLVLKDGATLRGAHHCLIQQCVRVEPRKFSTACCVGKYSQCRQCPLYQPYLRGGGIKCRTFYLPNCCLEVNIKLHQTVGLLRR